ncbi:MAG: adenylate/guanylate cyclase domain-containing response regulator [Desulfobacteraceae bacterium]|nr:MAG: adenylate/guanylate cyclase domain-containing response regulator [Desulfobacteraceae bacterium]
MQSILCIDDEEGVRRSLQRAFQREPYMVYTASNGPEGITLVKEHVREIATVVSDYKMPGMDGLETLQAIEKVNPEITRIILTGYATMEAAINATNSGIDGFLTKPFDNIELRAKIREIWVRKHLRQFVAEPIYLAIHQSPGTLAPRLHEVTILFSDIRNFTHMSQHVHPQELVDYLNNDYFTPMGDIAHHYQGTMDKHIGDSMMVVFGSPLAQPDDALRAVEAAVEMQREALKIDARLQQRHPHLRLRLGIGIAGGTVFSGIMGSMRKKEFTSVGLAVNIASRLQSMAGRGEILLDDHTMHQICAHFDACPLPALSVKGIDEPIRVYRIQVED